MIGTGFALPPLWKVNDPVKIMTATEVLQRMYDSELGTSLAESIYMYPLVEGTHLLSLAFSIGLLFVIDLRLTGLIFIQHPIDILLSKLRPWILAGFAATIITGVLLVAATGPKLLASFIFPLKLFLIVVAALNAFWFEIRYGKHSSNWSNARPPEGAKIAGWVSLISWSLVIILGRLIPYYDGN